jgi:hypothetical protein
MCRSAWEIPSESQAGTKVDLCSVFREGEKVNKLLKIRLAVKTHTKVNCRDDVDGARWNMLNNEGGYHFKGSM